MRTAVRAVRVQRRRTQVAPDSIRIHGDTLVSVPEASKLLGVHFTLVYRLIRDGELEPFIHPTYSRRQYVKRSAVLLYRRRADQWLAAHNRRRQSRQG